MTATIDLNADLGEGVGDDDAMLAIVTSANIACGFHAGSPTVLARTCAQAHRRGVAIGAQVSYPDREGFGLRYMAMDPEDLRADVVYQIGALAALASATGTRVRYVKPHGALNNAANSSANSASDIATSALNNMTAGSQLPSQTYLQQLQSYLGALQAQTQGSSAALGPQQNISGQYTNYLGAGTAADANAIARYQAQQQSSNNLWASILGLGGTAIGAFA